MRSVTRVPKVRAMVNVEKFPHTTKTGGGSTTTMISQPSPSTSAPKGVLGQSSKQSLIPSSSSSSASHGQPKSSSPKSRGQSSSQSSNPSSSESTSKQAQPSTSTGSSRGGSG